MSDAGKKIKYLFGPVNSRRLGRSLGIDLLKSKTCPLDCIYCECGSTKILTDKQKEYVPADEVIAELDQYLSESPEIDFITFSGSGEPTLHSKIEKIIKFLKSAYPQYKTALLTNGTLFFRKKTRKAVLSCDYIIPSIDAVNQDLFGKINKPAKGITAEKTIKGIKKLADEYKGILIIEIFIIPGLNDTFEEILKLKQTCIEINPHSIQLNTLHRPGNVNWIAPASNEKLNQIKELLKPLKAEIPEEIINYREKYKEKSNATAQEIKNKIYTLLKRRPCTIADIAVLSGYSDADIKTITDKMKKAGDIEETVSGVIFFRINKKDKTT